MNLYPVHNEPALMFNKTLIIADLHIGMEHVLRNAGFNIPSQSRKMMEKIIMLCREHNVNRVVIVGDIKHNIPNVSYQEFDEIPKFFEEILKFCNIDVAPGNHDGGIKKLLPKDVKIHSSKGFIFNNIGFFHGHSWPDENIMKCEYVVMGHNHPVIVFKDRLGYRVSKTCWLRGKMLKNRDRYKTTNPEIIIMPSFNKLCGKPVNEKKFLGPITKLLDIRNLSIYLLNGTFLGKIRDVKL
jgi:hypothetical protein